ncbi:hypothetical protein BWR18_20745 (plasmid) [Tateyamaria omphalii]|uniref:Uncharacterized protein n=1 Tax=Tateyamaria omphalii TaxID=299262 RepID=A0A1P8N1U2_9RHOB|nr:hypothetical protein BWR18_20745 [Tateyamaria omphalii]
MRTICAATLTFFLAFITGPAYALSPFGCRALETNPALPAVEGEMACFSLSGPSFSRITVWPKKRLHLLLN